MFIHPKWKWACLSTRSTSKLQKGPIHMYSLSTLRWSFAISYSQARLWTTTLLHQLFSTRSGLVKTHEDLHLQSQMWTVLYTTYINTHLCRGNFPSHIYQKINQSYDRGNFPLNLPWLFKLVVSWIFSSFLEYYQLSRVLSETALLWAYWFYLTTH